MSDPTLNDFGITQHQSVVVRDEDLLRDYLIERGHDHTLAEGADSYAYGVRSAAAMSADGLPLLAVLDTDHATDPDDPFDAPLLYLSADNCHRTGTSLSRSGLGGLGAVGALDNRPAYPLTLLTPVQPTGEAR